MAYAALISLKHTIERLQFSSRISLVPPSEEIIKSQHTRIQCLQETLKRLDDSCSNRSSITVSALDGKIREAVCKFEDILESHLSEQIASQSEESNGDETRPLLFSIDLQDLEEEMDSFNERVEKMEEEYIGELVKKMAYDGVISLKHILNRILKYPDISLVHPSPKIIESVHEKLKSLKELILQALDMSSSGKSVKALDEQIMGTVHNLQRVLMFDLLDQQVVSQSGSPGDGIDPSVDLPDLKQEIHSFTKMLHEIEDCCIKELENSWPVKEDDAVSSMVDFGRSETKMVGLSDEYGKLKEQLTMSSCDLGFQVIPIVGMAGMGKTTLAKEIFKDPDTCFDCRAWVAIGRKRKFEDVAPSILAQVNPDAHKMLAEGDEGIAEYLRESLEGKRYLIVLDDVWDSWVWDELEYLLPDEENGSRVLLTTRNQEVAQYFLKSTIGALQMELLNKEESWDLLRETLFAEEQCPPQLEKAGKKIAENCEALALTIVMVASLLSRVEKTPEYWNMVAANKQNSLFVDAYNEILKVLYPSYEYLDQYYKVCFLYIGLFPQNYEIPISKLINLWISGGFIERMDSYYPRYTAMQCLKKLINNNLVMAFQMSTMNIDTMNIDSSSSEKQIKTCGLHSSIWHLCKREAKKSKFSHVLNSRNDGLEEGMKSQRRLCFHNNILLGIKDVLNSVEDNCASTARSLLFYGPYHKYQVPICLGLKLLRELDALTIRLYEFPMEVLQLVQLRYLAFTLNGKLPPSISKLWNLQFLIVQRHMSIKSCGVPSYLPMEIWNMKELKHLEVMGSDLPDPRGASLAASMDSLSTLLNVSGQSCTEGILTAIPSLKKLGIRIELASDTTEPLCCLDHISHLEDLESLKCVVVNPESRLEVDAPGDPLSIFSSSLTKLSLSGLGYPWENMQNIASLPNLEVLKLRNSAFRGPKWGVEENGFLKLRFLLIEDTDLVQWKVARGSFPLLDHLSMKHCYKLEEYHGEFGDSLLKIELVDCNPSYIRQIKEVLSRKQCDLSPHVYARNSWDDENLKA